jgi:predicted deacylase
MEPILTLIAVLLAGAPDAPSAPRVARHRIGAQASWSTEYLVRDSGRTGPVVLIVGGIHGNEKAGVAAAEAIAGWIPKRGKLVVLSNANRRAGAANKRIAPSDRHGDLNRCFPRRSKDTPRGEVAVAIWKAVNEIAPDWIIDLHEGFDYRVRNAASVGNSVIYQPDETAEPVARTLVEKINKTIREKGRRFALLRYPKQGSLARACAQRLGSRAMIFETTRKQALDVRVAQHLLLVRHTLEEIGTLAPTPNSTSLPPSPPPSRRSP